MEEDIRKRGMLYMQQQKFGKKWKKVWSHVYGDSNCSVSRMELFECKEDAEKLKSERSRSKRESRRVIRMSDFVRVSEEKVGCPKDCGAFLVETTEKCFVFAVETSQLEEWIRTLCEIAFPLNQSRCDAFSGSDSGMVDNSLYVSSTALKDFQVTVTSTEASQRCGLHGDYTLRVNYDSIHLRDLESGSLLFTWPYKFLRKFGLHMGALSIEAGRRSASGEGVFMFKTKQNEIILRAIDGAIAFQSTIASPEASAPAPTPCPIVSNDSNLYGKVNKVARPPPPLDSTADMLHAAMENLDVDGRVPPTKERVRGMTSRPLPTPESPTYSLISGLKGQGSLEGGSLSTTSDYAVAGTPLMNPVHLSEGRAPELSQRLYDSISGVGTQVEQLEPVYEKVEARAAATNWGPVSLYNDVIEVKGQTWMAGTESDSDEHDYSEPITLREEKLPTTRYVYGEENPYDNDMPKMTEKGKR